MSVAPETSVTTPAEAQAGVQPRPQAGVLKSAPSWHSLARRITSRTTDLLAIAIVVVVSLTMGRQILRWWGTAAPQVLDMGPLDNLSADWGANSRPVALEFGNSPLTMTRQVLTQGGLPAALDAIRARCQQFLVSAGPPELPPDKGELDQLAALSALTPDIEQPGRWQLFSLEGGMVTVVGVKTFRDQTENLDRASPSTTRRVVCWGLVFPGLSPGSWTAYTFVRRQGQGSTAAGFDLSRLELPEGCQRTVLMQEPGQSGLLGFRGRLDPVAWKNHFENWLRARGWQLADPWSHQAGGWSSRYVKPAAGQAHESIIQVQFHLQNADQGVGLIHWLPGREVPPEAPRPTARGTP